MTTPLEAFLAAQGRLDSLQVLQPIQDILVRLRASEEPDQDGTTCLTLAADLMLTSGMPRPWVDRLIFQLVDRTSTQLLGTVIGLLDNRVLYASPAEGAAGVQMNHDGANVPGDLEPAFSVLINLAVIQQNLIRVTRQAPVP